MPDTNESLRLTVAERDTLLREFGALLKERTALQQALREQRSSAEAADEELYLEVLEVLDAMDFMLEYLRGNPAPNPQFLKRLPKSLGAIRQKLLGTLSRRDVQPLELGEGALDFTVCRVVDREPRSDLPDHTVTKVVRPGYLYKGKVLRPIEVITAKA